MNTLKDLEQWMAQFSDEDRERHFNRLSEAIAMLRGELRRSILATDGAPALDDACAPARASDDFQGYSVSSKTLRGWADAQEQEGADD